MSDFVYAEGDMVRWRGKPAKVLLIRLNGEVDLWTEFGQRTVLSDSIKPGHRGDTVFAVPAGWRGRHKAGKR